MNAVAIQDIIIHATLTVTTIIDMAIHTGMGLRIDTDIIMVGSIDTGIIMVGIIAVGVIIVGIMAVNSVEPGTSEKNIQPYE